MPVARHEPLLDVFAEAIRDGRLPIGTPLPARRELAPREHIALVIATRV